MILVNNNTLKGCFCATNLSVSDYQKVIYIELDVTILNLNLDLLFAIFFTTTVKTIHLFCPVGGFLSFFNRRRKMFSYQT